MIKPNKCDLCGLYLTSDCTACEECISNSKTVKSVALRSQNGDSNGRYEIDCECGETGDQGEL